MSCHIGEMAMKHPHKTHSYSKPCGRQQPGGKAAGNGCCHLGSHGTQACGGIQAHPTHP